MLSKVLVKLIDRAIVPAILLLATRVVSIVLISRYLGLPVKISKSGFVFESYADFVKVNSYSTLAMIVILILGLIYILLKSLAFHDSHIKPSLSAKVFSLKIQHLIQGSFHLYSEAAIWLSYAYLLLLFSGIMLVSKLLYNWVFYMAAGVTLVSTILFILDVEEEIKIKGLDKGESEYEYDEDKELLCKEELE
ncbi:MAG: hypothetical protein ABIJ82_02600 [Patescibacteria group bacterium]|nr:hypothetical protein [Patescibacteria group bacterium]MBU1953206.1 hypothetical protein [Patescibacteria group bacterium]